MIEPGEIKAKAEKLYPKFVKSWLSGEEFFPHRLRANLELPKEYSAAKKAVERLRKESKSERGFGYEVLWQSRKSRTHGLNEYPTQLHFETELDFLRSIQKQVEFSELKAAVEKIQVSEPGLSAWLLESTHWKQVLESSGIIGDLLLMTRFLVDNPRPDCFAREISLPVSTKLIEENKKLLSHWLDRLLPSDQIDFQFGRDEFEARYGLRYPRHHLLVRLLDPDLQSELGVPFREFSLPAATVNDLPIKNVTTFVVENKVNLLTLPNIERAIAIGGLGKAISLSREIDWLSQVSIYYWGDLDVEGFEMLSQFREIFPQVESLLMTMGTFRKYEDLAIDWVNRPGGNPQFLNEQEDETYKYLLENRKRLEQERIPQAELVERFGCFGFLS